MTSPNGSTVAPPGGGEHSDDRAEVLVVGAGPTGLALAIELARRGVDCRLLERNDRTVRSSRALAISPRTLQVFEDMGVLDDVLAEGSRVEGQTAFRGDRRLFRLDTDSVDTGARYPFVWLLPQDRTERILLERLEALGGEVEFGRELVGFRQDGAGVTARVAPTDGEEAEETVTADWLVGCDGARSPVRETLGLAFAGETRRESFLLADARLDTDWPAREVITWFHDDGVVAAFPMLAEGEWRLFVEVSSLPEAERPAPTAETFGRLLAERAGSRRPAVREVTWSSEYTVTQRMVRRYRDGRVFLAGYAAHVHSPLGGMGMNTGIQDAHNLGWKLALVVDGAAPEGLLDSYEAERLPVAERVLGNTGPATGLLTSRNPLVKLLRERLLGAALSRRPVQARLLGATTQLGIDYRGSPLSGSRTGRPAGVRRVPSVRAALRRARYAWRAPVAGDRAPDGAVYRPDGSRTSLYRELHGRKGFALLLFADTDAGSSEGESEDPVTVARRAAEHAGELVRPYLVVHGKPTGTEPEAIDLLFDPEGRLYGRYGADVPSLYLLRPDGYVGFRGRPARWEPLVGYLDDRLELGGAGGVDGDLPEPPGTSRFVGAGLGRR